MTESCDAESKTLDHICQQFEDEIVDGKTQCALFQRIPLNVLPKELVCASSYAGILPDNQVLEGANFVDENGSLVTYVKLRVGN